MRNPGVADDPLEIGNVGQRIQVVGLAQPLLTQIDQAEPLEPSRQRG